MEKNSAGAVFVSDKYLKDTKIADPGQLTFGNLSFNIQLNFNGSNPHSSFTLPD